MPSLPTLVWSPRTKVNGDVFIYFNPQKGQIKSFSQFSGGEVVTAVNKNCMTNAPVACADGGGFDAGVIWSPNSVAVGGLPVNSPIYTALEGGISPGGEGDIVANVCLPDPANDVIICFDGGVDANPGVSYKPVPRKMFPVDHYVQQRPDNKITLNDTFVSNWIGLQRIKGVPVTIIVKVSPGGTGIFSEIQYYSGVVLDPQPMKSGEDANASVGITMQGYYEFCAIFAAQPV